MKRPFFITTAHLALFTASALCIARTSSASEQAENAGHQIADTQFVEAERKLTNRLIEKTIAQAEANAALLGEVKSAERNLSVRLTSLKTNVEGKRLAAALDELSAAQVERLINEPIVLPQALEFMEKEIESISADLKKLHSAPPAGFVLPDAQQDELMQSSVSLRNMLSHLRERESWLTSVMSGAPRIRDLAKAPTLDAVLSDFRIHKQEALNAAKRKGIEEATPESLKQITDSARIAELERSLEQSRAMLAESRQATELSRLDSEMQLRLLRETKDRELTLLNKKLAESEARRAVVNAETDAALLKGKADAEKIRLRQKCEEPEVKKLLAPFTATGLWQPGDKPGQPWLHERGPVSLAALRKCGSLEPTERGLTQLYIVGNGAYLNWPYQVHPDKERPKWGFSKSPTQFRQEDWQQLRHIQDLVNELGQTMVELKILAE